MSRTTLASAKAELFGLLADADGVPTFTVAGVDAGTVRVYDHERRAYDFPISVTVAFGGSDAFTWRLTVRMYASTVRYDAQTGQAHLDLLLPAVEAKAVSNGGFDFKGWGPLTWDAELEVFLIAGDVEVGREDYQL